MDWATDLLTFVKDSTEHIHVHNLMLVESECGCSAPHQSQQAESQARPYFISLCSLNVSRLNSLFRMELVKSIILETLSAQHTSANLSTTTLLYFSWILQKNFSETHYFSIPFRSQESPECLTESRRKKPDGIEECVHVLQQCSHQPRSLHNVIGRRKSHTQSIIHTYVASLHECILFIIFQS